jgi:hypothetical protein
MKFWYLLIILVTAVPVMAEPAPKIYLLMGQSNISGRGDLAQLSSRAENPAIRLYGNDGVLRTAVEPLDLSTGQNDIVSADNLAAVGPGLSFAQTMHANYNDAFIILVPCAKGGASLKQWMPDASRNTLYGSCLARAKEVLSKGKLSGVIWYQGETDAGSLEETHLWSQRMVTLVTQLRHDLKAPKLPWVIVGLADYPTASKKPYPGWSDMQLAQAGLPKRIKYISHVSAAGLTTNADTLHLDTAAQLKLGPKLAMAMAKLQAKVDSKKCKWGFDFLAFHFKSNCPLNN